MPLPPAQPVYILRGHSAPIHAVLFIRSNSRLITADAEGWVVLWNVSTRRPVAVWKAHDASILGAAPWGEDRIITYPERSWLTERPPTECLYLYRHGRDNKLFVWELAASDEPGMDIELPVENLGAHRRHPWLLHMLAVNTLNFCSFALCEDLVSPDQSRAAHDTRILVAVPGTMDSGDIDVFQLPAEARLHTIPVDKSIKAGMIMSLGMFHQATQLTIVVGHESGHTIVHQRSSAGANSNWRRLYISQPHSQPVLSLDVSPSKEFYCTSSADAVLAKHPLLPGSEEAISKPLKTIHTKHSGQQGLKLRSDGTIFATAGWDSKIRVYAAGSMRELAVLKWHKDGCYAVAFAELDKGEARPSETADSNLTIGVNEIARQERPLIRMVEQRRTEKAKSTHWLAAGSKDGKVSLWDIY